MPFSYLGSILLSFFISFLGRNNILLCPCKRAVRWSCKISYMIFCLIWFFTSHQQSFSFIGMGLPGLNQYKARINVLAQGHNAVHGEVPTRGSSISSLKSSTLPLSHCAPFLTLADSVSYMGKGGIKKYLKWVKGVETLIWYARKSILYF